MRIVPPFLKAGDTVALVAPARKVLPAETAGLIRLLEGEWGLKVLLSPNLYGKHFQFSGTDEQRLSDLQWAFSHSDVRAIFCGRGGYGTLRIADQLNLEAFRKSPKWLCGYSDLTVLHGSLFQEGFCSLHSPMAIDWSGEMNAGHRTSAEQLRRALFGEVVRESAADMTIHQARPFQGPVTGGNLSVLYGMLGSSTFPETRGHVLFLEDIDEHFYHVDRMLTALKRAGKFEGLAALVCGHFTDMKDKDPANPFGETVEEMVLRLAGDGGYPIVFGYPAGHSAKNHCLQFGFELTFDGQNFEYQAPGSPQPLH